MNNEIQITNLNDLQAYTQGQVVELPSFADGMPFVARLRRPSLMVLAKSGKIPNELLRAANDLFMGVDSSKKSSKHDDNTLGQMYDLFEIICEASFVEPTWGDIKKTGLELTDEQLIFVFKYSQTGVNALKSFRTE